MAKILLSITLPEETINTSEARSRTSSDEYLLIAGLPLPQEADYWRFWTRHRALSHLLTELPNEQMTTWLDHLKAKRVIEDWHIEELKGEN